MRRAIPFLSVLVLVCVPAYGDEPTLQGEWRTSLGVVTFKPEGDAIVATFADPQIPPVKVTLTKKTATPRNEDGPKPGATTLTLDDSGRSFSGPFQFANGQRTIWNGWRPDPEATKAETGRFDGLWLTTIGLMELEQTGDKVKGNYAVRGTSKIEGTITGRQLDFRYQWFRNGKGWFDLTKDGKTLEGGRPSATRRINGTAGGAGGPRSSAGMFPLWRARSWMGQPRGCSLTASAPRRLQGG